MVTFTFDVVVVVFRQIVREGGSIGAVNVTWKVMYDRGNDLTEKGGLVYFASGQQVALLNIGVVGDTEPEVDEMFTILLKETSAVSVLIIIRGD